MHMRRSALICLLPGVLIMIRSTRMLFSPLLCLAVLAAPNAAPAGPADDLLPPTVRQTEKRSFGGEDDPIRRYHHDRQGVGAAFSPDGKLLVAAAGHQGMALWD